MLLVLIRDYAVSTLRRAAEEADGTRNPAKVATWRRQQADALRALPEIDRMLAGPVEAAETFARLALERKQALDACQAGLVSRLIGVSDPADWFGAIGSVFTSHMPVETMHWFGGWWTRQYRAHPRSPWTPSPVRNVPSVMMDMPARLRPSIRRSWRLPLLR
ncbi:hypothetical protein KHC28_11670 [Ancylobacter sonchi]|uniref:hypothetical protein n=1 Tax=Ancylobacter sonchi TaxID=1937790 RepID=UPI001BD3D6CB|nr:hypothetical protein [Ancylobacter sonchi]MBS7534315.1 hypothetical protein [Ancylobacter sonchi]